MSDYYLGLLDEAGNEPDDPVYERVRIDVPDPELYVNREEIAFPKTSREWEVENYAVFHSPEGDEMLCTGDFKTGPILVPGGVGQLFFRPGCLWIIGELAYLNFPSS